MIDRGGRGVLVDFDLGECTNGEGARQFMRMVSLWLSSLSVEPAADGNIPGHMAVYPDRATPQPK